MMMTNILVAAFIVIALLDQSSAYTWDEYRNVKAECVEMSKTQKPQVDSADMLRFTVKCFLDKNNIVNQDGPIDSPKLEGILVDLLPPTTLRTLVLEEIKSCSNTAGETREQRLTNYTVCLFNNPTTQYLEATIKAHPNSAI